MPPAIILRHLSKSFPRSAHSSDRPARSAPHDVLRDVNLEVEHGSVVGLLGPNGAGKTTLLEILCTLLLPTGGEALVEGLDVVGDAAGVKQLVGYCPCGFDSFYPRLTALANLEFFGALHGLPPRDGRQRVRSVCDLVGINGSRHLDFQRHSSGMKQKLVLARALMTDPPVLLLDEPTKSLDPRAQRDMWRLLRARLVDDLQKTILLVTHSLAEAQEVCDRIAILDEGRIVDVGPPASLTSRRLAEMLGGEREEGIDGRDGHDEEHDAR
jgi:ABC-2 type transport system ATP-binding protein